MYAIKQVVSLSNDRCRITIVERSCADNVLSSCENGSVLYL